MALTGKSYPVTGVLNLHAQTDGTIGDLNGTGQLSLTGGVAYGEQYRSLTSDVQFRGREVSASHLMFAMDGGRITGEGGYDFTAKTAHFDLQGSGFELAHIRRLENEQYPVGGTVEFTARGGGTVDSPTLEASMHVRGLSLAREFTGLVDVDAHTQGRALQVHMTSHLNTSHLELNAETQLTGDYLTRASLNISGFNIDPLLRTFSVTGIRGSSSIAGAVTVSGPLRHPKQLNGDVRLSQLAVTLEDVPIHSDGDLHATLRDGTFQMDPLHIVGTDTDLRTEGSIGVFSDPRPIHGMASGSINMALAQTLDTDIISSGHVDFTRDRRRHGAESGPEGPGEVHERERRAGRVRERPEPHERNPGFRPGPAGFSERHGLQRRWADPGGWVRNLSSRALCRPDRGGEGRAHPVSGRGNVDGQREPALPGKPGQHAAERET